MKKHPIQFCLTSILVTLLVNFSTAPSAAEDYRMPDLWQQVVDSGRDMSFSEIESYFGDYFNKIAKGSLAKDEFIELGRRSRDSLAIEPRGVHGMTLTAEQEKAAKDKTDAMVEEADGRLFAGADVNGDGKLSRAEYIELSMKVTTHPLPLTNLI